MLVEMLLKDQSPMIKALVGSLVAMIPGDAIAALDAAFANVARDLANGRDAEALEKIKQVFQVIGIDLNAYRD